MSSYTEFFLNSISSIVQLELIEISHPNFSQTYYIVRNAVEGVTVTLEDGVTTQFFQYYPLRITNIESRDNLDSGLKIQLGDLGELLPSEFDLVRSNNGFGTKPTLKYRVYRSDDLSSPMFGPITLEIINFIFNKEGASFEATAPSVNINKTGERYRITNFPMLKGFL